MASLLLKFVVSELRSSRLYLAILVLALIAAIAEVLPPARAPLAGIAVEYLVETDGGVWLDIRSADNPGVYFADRNTLYPIRILPDRTLNDVASVDGVTIVGTDDGAFLIADDKAVPIGPAEYIYDLAVVGEELWLATSKGAFRLSAGRDLVDIPHTKGRTVQDIALIGKDVWLATEIGALRVTDKGQVKDEDSPFLKEGTWVTRIALIPVDAVWLSTFTGVFRWSAFEQEFTAQTLRGTPAENVLEVAGDPWVTSGNNLYRIRNGDAVRITLPDPESGNPVEVKDILQAKGEIWIATSRTLYRIAREDEADAVISNIFLNDIELVEGELWLATDDGPMILRGESLGPAMARPVSRVHQLVRDSSFALAVILLLYRLLVAVRNWRSNSVASTRRDLEIEEARQQMERVFPPKGLFERPGLRLAHRSRQASAISGDFYNFIPRADGSLGVYFVDVEGHGLAAAHNARDFYHAVSSEEWGHSEPYQELARADEIVSWGALFRTDDVGLVMNFTVLNPDAMTITHSNAGMPPPLLVRAGQSQPEFLQAAGVYIGLGYSRYDIKLKVAEATVADGDLLVIMSDGIVEARDDRGRLFGINGVISAVYRVLDRGADGIASEIMRSVTRHADVEIPDDDQTLVVVEIGDTDSESTLTSIPTFEQLGNLFRLKNTSEESLLEFDEKLVPALRQQILSLGYDQARFAEIVSAAFEAIQNALRYGSDIGDLITLELTQSSDRDRVGLVIR